MAAAYRGRFAPSPTGPLHFGSLVTAMASYADARSAGGAWFLRIEDVDTTRSRAGVDSEILAMLERLGFAWDGPVWRQSQRSTRYEDALDRLRRDAIAYPCTCTRQDLATAALSRIGERIYPGRCRDRADATALANDRSAWRLRVPVAPVVFVDRLHGPQSQVLAIDVGDFIVRRGDGLHAYQLAVVVDDAEQGITDVVRGADLLASTPRQIYLQRRLEMPTPRYLHVPIALDAAGAKLSKRYGAAALAGDPLGALLGAWNFLGQTAPEATPASTGEFWSFAIGAWEPRRLPRAPMLAAPPAFGS